MQFNSEKPTVSAMYLVDRGAQGKAYRWYNADTDQWGLCAFDMNEAFDNKDKTAVGFFPWVGPLTGPNYKAAPKPHVSNTDNPVDFPKAKKRMSKATGVKQVVGNTKVYSIMKSKAKVVHPDGTVFYRADRGKWVAMWAGKQEAARPTAEACLAFLLKKYNHTGVVIPKE